MKTLLRKKKVPLPKINILDCVPYVIVPKDVQDFVIPYSQPTEPQLKPFNPPKISLDTPVETKNHNDSQNQTTKGTFKISCRTQGKKEKKRISHVCNQNKITKLVIFHDFNEISLMNLCKLYFCVEYFCIFIHILILKLVSLIV